MVLLVMFGSGLQHGGLSDTLPYQKLMILVPRLEPIASKRAVHIFARDKYFDDFWYFYCFRLYNANYIRKARTNGFLLLFSILFVLRWTIQRYI